MSVNATTQVKQSWVAAVHSKTAAERRAALEVFLDAPIESVLRYAREGRKSVLQRSRPQETGATRSFIFAASIARNVLNDAVHIHTMSSNRRVQVSKIHLCEKIIVSRIPNDSYLIREIVRAAAGNPGGARIVNVDEYMGGCHPDFRADFKRNLPRLKSYRFRGGAVPCFWTGQQLKVNSWAKRLSCDRDVELESTLKELDSIITYSNIDSVAESDARTTLNRLLTSLFASRNLTIKNTATRVWNLLNASVLSTQG